MTNFILVLLSVSMQQPTSTVQEVSVLRSTACLCVNRVDPLRNHVRFSPIPSDHDWKSPEPYPSPGSSSPLRLDLDRDHPGSGELIPNANPNLNGVAPARAKWAQKGGYLIHALHYLLSAPLHAVVAVILWRTPCRMMHREQPVMPKCCCSSRHHLECFLVIRIDSTAKIQAVMEVPQCCKAQGLNSGTIKGLCM